MFLLRFLTSKFLAHRSNDQSTIPLDSSPPDGLTTHFLPSLHNSPPTNHKEGLIGQVMKWEEKRGTLLWKRIETSQTDLSRIRRTHHEKKRFKSSTDWMNLYFVTVFYSLHSRTESIVSWPVNRKVYWLAYGITKWLLNNKKNPEHPHTRVSNQIDGSICKAYTNIGRLMATTLLLIFPQ